MDIRQPLVAGNWKLNGSRSSVIALAEAVSRGLATVTADVLVCPSHVHLSDVLDVVGNTAVRLGAQDCAAFTEGAYTGETSVRMLTEFGCEYVIVGHSERRQYFGDTDAIVGTKVRIAQEAGITPILCVGESLEQRDAGQIENVIRGQISAVLGDDNGTEKTVVDLANLVIAYEPVWAIGTGKTASPEQAQEVHEMIRSTIAAEDDSAAQRLRILYGGSVNASNAAELMAQTDIDGGLVGGASLVAENFLAICEAA